MALFPLYSLHLSTLTLSVLTATNITFLHKNLTKIFILSYTVTIIPSSNIVIPSYIRCSHIVNKSIEFSVPRCVTQIIAFVTCNNKVSIPWSILINLRSTISGYVSKVIRFVACDVIDYDIVDSQRSSCSLVRSFICFSIRLLIRSN